MVEEEVANKAEDAGVEGEAVRRRAASHRDLERRGYLRENRAKNTADNIIDELVKHRRAYNKEKDREEKRVHDFLR